MSHTVLPQGKTYEEVYARFRWSVPPTFNIAVAICDRHAGDPARVAMIYEDEAGRVSEHTFAEFRARSNQLARALQAVSGSIAATVSGSSCRSARNWRSSISPRTSSAPSCCRSPRSSGPRRSSTGCATRASAWR